MSHGLQPVRPLEYEAQSKRREEPALQTSRFAPLASAAPGLLKQSVYILARRAHDGCQERGSRSDQAPGGGLIIILPPPEGRANLPIALWSPRSPTPPPPVPKTQHNILSPQSRQGRPTIAQDEVLGKRSREILKPHRGDRTPTVRLPPRPPSSTASRMPECPPLPHGILHAGRLIVASSERSPPA